MDHIFISYSHMDSDFAELVRLELDRNGYNVWTDSIRLKAGEDWRQGIDNAIHASSCVVVIVSPDAMQSAYVTYEWAYALGRGIPIVPIVYRTTNLHPRLESLQYLDFSHRTNRPWGLLTSRLEDLV